MATARGAGLDSLMLGILPLECPVRHYDWGSRTALGRLLGRPASGRPEAELWMGAHPAAPSVAQVGCRRVTLERLIADRPIETLGRCATAGRGAALPFLFKLLALGGPVSVQVHPTRARAARGFDAEERTGVPIDAPHRCYRDRGHKPELLLALEPMEVMAGIRPRPEIEAALAAAGVAELAAPAAGRDAAAAVGRVLRAALTLDRAAGARLHRRLVAGAAPGSAAGTVAGGLLVRLAERYPGDPAVIAALLLNRVALRPGEALYTPPGQLHAFVSGAGVELMASSDNVLRAGLTTKHVDVDELLAAGDLRPAPPARVPPRPAGPAEQVYPTPAEEFELSVIDLQPGGAFAPRRGPEILLLLGDGARLRWPGGTLALRRGDAVFVPAAVPTYEARGAGRLYRARVP